MACWSSAEASWPASRHRAVGTESGGTSQSERANHTMRQRIARAGRKPLSSAKKVAHQIGAMWRCVHHDNASLGL
jgi:hypothetical protein